MVELVVEKEMITQSGSGLIDLLILVAFYFASVLALKLLVSEWPGDVKTNEDRVVEVGLRVACFIVIVAFIAYAGGYIE